MNIPISYRHAFAFLDIIWHNEKDDDLGALLGSMQICEGDQGLSTFDSAFLNDWNALAKQTHGDDGYETLIKFLQSKADWSAKSNYLSRLSVRMKSTERETMTQLWRGSAKAL
jgi:hypothetical protein